MESHYVICLFLSGWKVACRQCFSTEGCICVFVCVLVCLQPRDWPCCVCVCQTAAQWTPVCVCVCAYRCWCVINSTAVPCFSPWAAAGTSWFSERVWWAGRWAAACVPAAAAAPDGGDGHNNTTPVNMTATAQNTAANGQYNPSKTIYHRDYTVCLFVLCLLSTEGNWL